MSVCARARVSVCHLTVASQFYGFSASTVNSAPPAFTSILFLGLPVFPFSSYRELEAVGAADAVTCALTHFIADPGCSHPGL